MVDGSVLVVEKSYLSLSTLVLALENNGIGPIRYATTPEAVSDRLREMSPSHVLVDHSMGADICSSVKESSPNAKIIYFPASEDPEDAEYADSLAADGESTIDRICVKGTTQFDNIVGDIVADLEGQRVAARRLRQH